MRASGFGPTSVGDRTAATIAESHRVPVRFLPHTADLVRQLWDALRDGACSALGRARRRRR